jgi:hypothetical protein
MALALAALKSTFLSKMHTNLDVAQATDALMVLPQALDMAKSHSPMRATLLCMALGKHFHCVHAVDAYSLHSSHILLAP